MKNKNRSKNEPLWRLLLVAVGSVLAASVAGVLMLAYYFAPRATNAGTVTVPDLVGACADSVSVPEGIVLECDYAYSDEVDAGAVISQAPLPNSVRRCPDGESVCVRVTVSLGKKTGSVPDVSGLPYVEAAIRLRDIGARVSAISVYDTDDGAGTVICSSPPKGTEIKEGDKVVIYVARKRMNASVRIPSFIGMKAPEAITEILALGLALGDVEYMLADDALIDRVVAQNPCPDIYVKNGTLINITVGCGKLASEPGHPE